MAEQRGETVKAGARRIRLVGAESVPEMLLEDLFDVDHSQWRTNTINAFLFTHDWRFARRMGVQGIDDGKAAMIRHHGVHHGSHLIVEFAYRPRPGFNIDSLSYQGIIRRSCAQRAFDEEDLPSRDVLGEKHAAAASLDSTHVNRADVVRMVQVVPQHQPEATQPVPIAFFFLASDLQSTLVRCPFGHLELGFFALIEGLVRSLPQS